MLELFVASIEIADAIPVSELSEYRKQKIYALKRNNSQRQSIAAGGLLAYALKRCFGIDEKFACYSEREQGKPYMSQYPDIHFSISHTEGLCAVAVSDMPVGVDAEYRDMSDVEKKIAVAERFFSPSERMSYGLIPETQMSDSEYLNGFYSLWTAKESLAKCSGKGLAESIGKYEIPFFEKTVQLGEHRLSAFRLDTHTVTVCAACCEDVKMETVTGEMAKEMLL